MMIGGLFCASAPDATKMPAPSASSDPTARTAFKPPMDFLLPLCCRLRKPVLARRMPQLASYENGAVALSVRHLETIVPFCPSGRDVAFTQILFDQRAIPLERIPVAAATRDRDAHAIIRPDAD